MEKKLIKNSILIAVPLIMLIFCQPNEKNAPAKPAGQNYLEEMTVTQLQQGYRQGKYTIPLVVKDYLERIAAIDQKGPKLNSIIRINPDALQIAAGPGATILLEIAYNYEQATRHRRAPKFLASD